MNKFLITISNGTNSNTVSIESPFDNVKELEDFLYDIGIIEELVAEQWFNYSDITNDDDNYEELFESWVDNTTILIEPYDNNKHNNFDSYFNITSYAQLL